MYICIHIMLCMYVYIYIYIYICVCVYIYIYIYIYYETGKDESRGLAFGPAPALSEFLARPHRGLAELIDMNTNIND